MNDPDDSNNPYKAPRSAPEFIEPEFHGGNPLFTIWFRPRATLCQILNTDPTRGVLVLAMLQGVGQGFGQAVLKSLGDKFSVGQIVALCLIAGPVGGLLSLYLSAWLLRWTGRWLGGRGTQEQVRAALAWSYVPAVCSLFLLIPEYGLIGKEIFTSETPRLDENTSLQIASTALGVLEIVLGLWSLVLSLKCLGEAHQFSAWRALGALVLGALLVLAILLPLILLVVMLAVAGK